MSGPKYPSSSRPTVRTCFREGFAVPNLFKNTGYHSGVHGAPTPREWTDSGTGEGGRGGCTEWEVRWGVPKKEVVSSDLQKIVPSTRGPLGPPRWSGEFLSRTWCGSQCRCRQMTKFKLWSDWSKCSVPPLFMYGNRPLTDGGVL